MKKTNVNQTDRSAFKRLYVEELRDIYNSENQLTKTLPKMVKAATSGELSQGFRDHLEETKGHIERLDEIFSALGENPDGKKCKGMEGLVEEAQEMIEDRGFRSDVLDSALISAAQRVEHYEIAAYRSVRKFAHILGEIEASSLLVKTLGEEEETDQKLTELAETVNSKAAGSI